MGNPTPQFSASPNGRMLVWNGHEAPAYVDAATARQIIGMADGQIPGTTTNDDAAPGNVGEYVSADVALASAISLTTGVLANLTSIVLTPGDWDVSFAGSFLPAATTTLSRTLMSVSTTSAAVDTTLGRLDQMFYGSIVPGGSVTLTSSIAPRRFSVSTNTAVYGVVFAAFGTSTCTAFGNLSARRVR